MLPERVAVIDPCSLLERPLLHWSYWSHEQTFYDRFAISAWQRAEVVDVPPESIAPYTLRLVRSADVFAHMADLLRAIPVEWLQTTARSFARRDDKLYEVVTDAGTIHASWVFDSALEVAPTFPSPHQPQALLSGTGVRVKADRAVFDATTATLFDPLDERSFRLLAAAEPRRGAAGVGFVRFGRSGRRPNNFTPISSSTASAGPLSHYPCRVGLHTAGVRALANYRPPAYLDRRKARPHQAQCRLRRGSNRQRKRTSGPPVASGSTAATKLAEFLAVAAAR
jgi:hypothetical protein